ncbi:MAG: serine/threonine-protein kinase [Terriglobales bacterium]
MAMMFGRFEIQSEVSKSETASIYKALDTQTSQVVALKTQSLAPLGDRAAAFVDTLIAEGELALPLTSQNIVPLYGAGEIDGQFCAAMEYVQGNSIASMLARNEGFSIWDLMDITRQVCAAMEHAAARGVVHSSLEPDKILVQWDGLVKVLGYGISNMSLIEAESGNGLGRLMPYCSPEQIRGEPMDRRSNQFTLGTILYEMVAGRKAFDATDPVVLVGQIENEMPAEVITLNPKIQPAVSALIMKALAKDPAERYQTARELLVDLENCKESAGKKIGPETRKIAARVKFDTATRQAVAKKFVSSAPSENTPATARPTAATLAAERAAVARAAAAAVGRSSRGEASSTFGSPAASTAESGPAANSGTRLIEIDDAPKVSARENFTARGSLVSPSTPTSAPEPHSPTLTADPMMADTAPSRLGTSFSDIDELPPLKQPAFAPPPPPQPEESAQPAVQQTRKAAKPKVPPREVAGKAIREIATLPPRLVLFSILAAVVVILVVAVGLFLHVHSEDDGSVPAPRPIKAASTPAPAARAPGATHAQKTALPEVDSEPAVTVRHFERHRAKSQQSPAPAPEPAIVPGEALIDSTPQGAQFQLDGKSDSSWVTPFAVIGLSAGKHIVSASKSGYTTEIRSVDVASNGKSSVVFHLTPMNALVVVTSSPAGAEITIDGRPTGKVSPAQFAVQKGNHTVLLKKQGFLDETTSATLGPGQNFQYAPVLKTLGDTEAIHTVGRFKRIFGAGGESTAGMGSVSIHTQPKGAQVVINQRILDKMSPVDVVMDPGNYVVDITLTGFKPVHKVVRVEKGDKIAIDEVLER